MPKAIVKTLAGVALLAISFAIGLQTAYPDPALMYTIAQVGIAIVFAFVIEAVWMVERIDRNVDRRDREHRDWLGTACGFALAGLLGVASALGVGAHRAAGHANFLDAVGLWWSIASLAVLGGIVVVRPLLADIDRAKKAA